MITYLKNSYEKLITELRTLDARHQPDLFKPDERLICIEKFIDEVKEKSIAYEFTGAEEEIRFYKSVLPPVISLWIYYKEKSGLEIMELIGTRKSRTEYQNRLLKRIDDFSIENMEFYEYCSLGKTNSDAHYFLRSSSLNRQGTLIFDTVMDPRFCPSYCVKIATLSAYRRLDEDLSNQFGEKYKETPNASIPTLKPLKWTGSITGLTELAYCLHKGGYINNGEASIKDVVENFQYLFQVNFGNYTRTWQEILCRKKGQTQFISKLLSDFQKWIEESDL